MEKKNGVKGKVIGLTLSGDDLACAVRALTRRVRHLRAHHAPPNTKLYTYFDSNRRPHHIGSSHLTELLRLACILRHLPTDTVSARALRTSALCLTRGLEDVLVEKIVIKVKVKKVIFILTDERVIVRPFL